MSDAAHGKGWVALQPLRRIGAGIDIVLEEADTIAGIMRRADVLAYADAVFQEISSWLSTCQDSDFDQFPNVRQHLRPLPEPRIPTRRLPHVSPPAASGISRMLSEERPKNFRMIAL